MKTRKNVFFNKLKPKTILILVECLPGALNAGRFVFNQLYDNQTQIILMQTFKAPNFGMSMIRNITQKLNDASLQDLTTVKNSLIEEFGIPSDHIQKVAIEGDLDTSLKHNFNNYENLTVVIGDDLNPLNNKIPFSQITTIMKATNIRPIFYIANNITVISHSKINVISDNTEGISEIPEKFFVKKSKSYGLDIEYINADKKNVSSILGNGPHLFSQSKDSSFSSLNPIENLYKECC